MKKYLFILMALVIVLGSALVFTQAKAAQQAPAPNLVVYPPISDLNSKTTIAILGSGFTPHNEYNIMFHDGFGSIGALEETVVADERGNFIAGWALGRYTRGGILWDGSTDIMIADMQFNVMASAPVAFFTSKKPKDEWPSWALAATSFLKAPK